MTKCLFCDIPFPSLSQIKNVSNQNVFFKNVSVICHSKSPWIQMSLSFVICYSSFFFQPSEFLNRTLFLSFVIRHSSFKIPWKKNVFVVCHSFFVIWNSKSSQMKMFLSSVSRLSLFVMRHLKSPRRKMFLSFIIGPLSYKIPKTKNFFHLSFVLHDTLR